MARVGYHVLRDFVNYAAHSFVTVANLTHLDVTQSPDTPYTTTTTATAAATTFNMLSVTRQVHSLFQSAFYTGSELVFHISISLSSCFIKAIRKLLTSSSLPSRHVYFQSIFPSIMCFRRQLLRKMLPFVLLYVCVGYSYPP